MCFRICFGLKQGREHSGVNFVTRLLSSFRLLGWLRKTGISLPGHFVLAASATWFLLKYYLICRKVIYIKGTNFDKQSLFSSADMHFISDNVNLLLLGLASSMGLILLVFFKFEPSSSEITFFKVNWSLMVLNSQIFSCSMLPLQLSSSSVSPSTCWSEREMILLFA